MAKYGHCYFKSTGAAFPNKSVSNDFFANYLETSDEWIASRTGIRSRHISDSANPKEWNSHLGFLAAEIALKRAKLDVLDIDAIIFATATPDTFVPSTACWVQSLLGANRSLAFDVNAACSGFLYSVVVANGLMASSSHIQNILVIGGEVLSSFMNWNDRNSCVLFGDGAGAAVLSRRKDTDIRGIMGWSLGSRGDLAPLIQIPSGASRLPADAEHFLSADAKIQLRGNEVFKQAVECMVSESQKVCERAGVTIADIDLFVPHQANLRIIEMVAERLKFPMDRVVINLDRRGNTSAASIPTAADEAIAQGRLKDGQKILATSFGAGATFGSILVQT